MGSIQWKYQGTQIYRIRPVLFDLNNFWPSDPVYNVHTWQTVDTETVKVSWGDLKLCFNLGTRLQFELVQELFWATWNNSQRIFASDKSFHSNHFPDPWVDDRRKKKVEVSSARVTIWRLLHKSAFWGSSRYISNSPQTFDVTKIRLSKIIQNWYAETSMIFIVFFIESAHWADSIIESRCPFDVCLMSPSHAIF